MVLKYIFMKRILILLACSFFVISSCETDEICDQTIQPTPSLVVTFYDNDNPDTRKEVTDFSAKLIDKDDVISLKTTDSINIPLDIFNLNTSYQFNQGELIDNMEFTYTTKQIFMSKSCGYRTQFSDLSATVTNNWIKKISVEETIINDQKTEHVKIYH
ncbi:MAG: hypothetical protein COB60_02275 [Flavobacteriaceae bacterium]|nr:MAG: hypothetical protein COB60_02275 [Flavobacteriaceae bacterium]